MIKLTEVFILSEAEKGYYFDKDLHRNLFQANAEENSYKLKNAIKEKYVKIFGFVICDVDHESSVFGLLKDVAEKLGYKVIPILKDNSYVLLCIHTSHWKVERTQEVKNAFNDYDYKKFYSALSPISNEAINVKSDPLSEYENIVGDGANDYQHFAGALKIHFANSIPFSLGMLNDNKITKARVQDLKDKREYQKLLSQKAMKQKMLYVIAESDGTLSCKKDINSDKNISTTKIQSAKNMTKWIDMGDDMLKGKSSYNKGTSKFIWGKEFWEDVLSAAKSSNINYIQIIFEDSFLDHEHVVQVGNLYNYTRKDIMQIMASMVTPFYPGIYSLAALQKIFNDVSNLFKK